MLIDVSGTPIWVEAVEQLFRWSSISTMVLSGSTHGRVVERARLGRDEDADLDLHLVGEGRQRIRRAIQGALAADDVDRVLEDLAGEIGGARVGGEREQWDEAHRQAILDDDAEGRILAQVGDGQLIGVSRVLRRRCRARLGDRQVDLRANLGVEAGRVVGSLPSGIVFCGSTKALLVRSVTASGAITLIWIVRVLPIPGTRSNDPSRVPPAQSTMPATWLHANEPVPAGWAAARR